MSLSVDDLVQSLKANHIDQEAIELAALQAQLSQTLFQQPLSSPVPFNSPRAAPLNTPISCTPSSSSSWESADATWGNRGSTSSLKMRCSIDESQRESDDMDEDERMVEDLLFSPASPTSPSGSFSRAPPSAAPATSPTPSSALRQRKASLSMHMLPLEHSHHDLPSPNTSLFATTDPFYLASLHNAHSHAPSSSVFAQAGRPAAHSPFMKHHHHMQSMYAGFGHGFQSVAPDVQSHNMFAPTAAFSA
ncbi:hypothetical protein PYCCODRAFT_1368854 [Trametes coccinea BRFM310]|uniref:Uncharacterized protein n=1 Tax=Trametes coccinea (strain BRFM310) TaxID=1353009 RepID=A0A1Y2IKX1_TRAC3|nr:hypothetical protein PYCCODRAFT_1368854 [Trametes coccinea BRFM310]